MIRRLRLRSFKAFSSAKETVVDVRPLTLFVGPNGSGKSTILQAVAILGDLARGTIDEMLERRGWEYRDLPHLLAKGQKISIGVDLELDGQLVYWDLVLEHRKHPGIAEEHVERDAGDGNRIKLVARTGRRVETFFDDGSPDQDVTLSLASSWLSTLDEDADEERRPTLVALARWAKRIRSFFYLDPVALRAPSRSKTDEIGEHGEDLAGYLVRLKAQPKRLARLVNVIKAQYPRLVELAPKRGKYGWTKLEVTEKWNGETATFNARQVSDGLLRMIAVASLATRDEKPSVLLFDEIDNGLHPSLLAGLVEILDGMSKATQVLATSHSPLTLNYVPDESAMVVTRGTNGAVSVTPLNAAPGFEALRERMGLGELWYNLGEKRITRSNG